MMPKIIEALVFVASAVLNLASILLLLRFFMQFFRVAFSNPLGHIVLTLTSPLVLPLRRIIPGLFGLDLASLLAAYLLLVLKTLIILWGGNFPIAFTFGLMPDFSALGAAFLVGALDLLTQAIYLFIYALLAQAILSWVKPFSPWVSPINQLTQPILRPIRRLVPTIGNIDLSPLIAILLAQVLLILMH